MLLNSEEIGETWGITYTEQHQEIMYYPQK